MLYPKAFVTIVATVVLITITKITDARSISTWFQRKCTCISIPILERKRAANRLRIGSTYNTKCKMFVNMIPDSFMRA